MNCEKSRLERSGLVSRCAFTSAATKFAEPLAAAADIDTDGGMSCGLFGLDGSRPRRPFKLAVLTTSFTMPTFIHFWKRQNWHRFRRRLSTGQFLSARHTYLAFFWTVRLKKPLQPSQVLKIRIYESIANISTNMDQSLKKYLSFGTLQMTSLLFMMQFLL